jgi:hypothetical protein
VFERLNARLAYALLAVAALLAFSLSFLVVADGSAGPLQQAGEEPEMVSMSIVIICFLLAGYAVQSRSMIRTDVLVIARCAATCCRRCSRARSARVLHTGSEPALRLDQRRVRGRRLARAGMAGARGRLWSVLVMVTYRGCAVSDSSRCCAAW